MLNEKADKLLKEEVAPKEILKFLQDKYEVNYLVHQRTIKRWIDELNIECIKPRPKRNRDIKYKKSDVLKLEGVKRGSLLRLKNKELDKASRERMGKQMKQILEDGRVEYNNSLFNMTDEEKRQQDIEDMYDFSHAAIKHIKEDKLEMCFKKLFPNVVFDQKELENLLLINSEPDMYTDEEYGQAKIDLEIKSYRKNYNK